MLAYPTTIGSEPDHPEFDTEPLWRQVIVGNAIANGLFMIVPNRWGCCCYYYIVVYYENYN